ncbi:hypothetical protein M9H77_12696 [Catharanthus roseus]|uniref:Uncharacterized protein n=1 Tax=Catharanthus roseus TaxID=4058 RepID=A0ACC0BI71_CATRO|nr:hypothetical protein M9H77_12696 [Catharanthus roseus]
MDVNDSLVIGFEQQQRQIVQEIQPAKPGQNKAILPALTTLIVRHHYSLLADRGNIKSMTSTKVGDFVAKQPRDKGIGKVSQACIVTAREELKVAQSSLHDNPQDTTLRRVVRDLDDGSTRSSSMDEIHSEFLVYYSNLLGTKEDVDDFDATVMDFGPKVSPLQDLIFHMSAAVLDRFISLCCQFLWGGNYARVAWKTILDLQAKKDFLSFVKRIISIRDKIIEVEGSTPNVIGHLSSWHLRFFRHFTCL